VCIDLEAQGANGNVIVNSNITSQTGKITIGASDSITQATGTTISTNGADIDLAADKDLDGTGGIVQNGTAQILSNNGDIRLLAGSLNPVAGGGDIYLGYLDSGTGGVWVGTGLGSIYDNNGNDNLNIKARDYSYLRAPTGVVGTDALPVDVCVQINALNALTPPQVDGADATSGLIIQMGGGANGGTSGSIRGIVRPGSGLNNVTGAPQIMFTDVDTGANTTPLGFVYYQDDSTVGAGCTVLAGYPDATDLGYRLQIWPPLLGNAAHLLGEKLKFKIPKKGTADAFQIQHTQGPATLTGGQVYFYHPLIEMSMYETPALGVEVYDFIDNSISPRNPALLPILIEEEEEEERF